MRRLNKLLCDCCFKVIGEISKKKMEHIKKEKQIGSRVNCSAICKKCSFTHIKAPGDKR